MMPPKAPDALALILAKKKPGSAAPDDMPAGDDKEAAAADIMDAMKAGDTKGFATALESFVSMCQSPSEG